MTAPRDRIYFGKRYGDGAKVHIVHGPPLDPCLNLVNHSPDGFEWGYLGSGPSQLAFALIHDVLSSGEPQSAAAIELTQKLYHDFKADKIATIRDDEWQMTAGDIRDWIKSKAPPCFSWSDEETKQ
jgi:hypothetical protein